MKACKILCLVCILLFVAAAAPSAGAKLSLGSAQDKKEAAVYPGESAKFKILFFNIYENSTLRLALSTKENPSGWVVSISPESLYLNYSTPQVYKTPEEGFEYLGLPGIAGDIKVKPVLVTINTASDSKPGTYNVKVEASAGKSGGAISAYQVRSFDLKVRVIGDVAPEGTTENNAGNTRAAVLLTAAETQDAASGGNTPGNESGNATRVISMTESGNQTLLLQMEGETTHPLLGLALLIIAAAIAVWKKA
jgi:hypothetical protein